MSHSARLRFYPEEEVSEIPWWHRNWTFKCEILLFFIISLCLDLCKDHDVSKATRCLGEIGEYSRCSG